MEGASPIEGERRPGSGAIPEIDPLGILRGISDGITVQEAGGRLVYVNEAAARLSGYESAAEMLAAPIDNLLGRFELMDEEGHPITRENFPGARVMRGEDVGGESIIRFRIVATGEERWSSVRAIALPGPDGSPGFIVNTFRDITERKEDERRLRFLTTASELLASSLDYQATLTSVARLAVPHIADWCAIDMLTPGGGIERLAVAHIDPEKVKWAHELQRRYPIDINAPTGAPYVIRTGEHEFYPVITEEMILAATQSEEDLKIIREIGFSSVMTLPLTVHGRTLGALSLVSAESGKHYTEADLRLAQDLARRAAVAVENARLHREAEEQRERLRVTLSSIGDAVIATDTAGRITFMNPVAERLTAWGLPEATGRDLTEIFPIVNEVTRTTVENPVDRVIATGAVVGLANHTVLLARDRTELPIDDSAAPIRDEDGRMMGVVLVFHDVTERRQGERERAALLAREQEARALAEQSERRYRTLAEARPQIVWTARPDGSIDYFNPQWYDYTGQREEEAEGWGWEPAIHPDDRDAAMGAWGRSLASGEPFQAELRLRRGADGAYRWYLARAVAMLDEKGEIVQWIGTSTDIDDQKRAEERLEFLAGASELLASSLDYQTTLASVAALAVPHIADWCAVDMLTDDGSVERLAAAHNDPAKLKWARELYDSYPPDLDAPAGLGLTLRTGRSEFYPEVTPAMLEGAARDAGELEMFREIGFTSVMVVPLVVSGRTIGSISFVAAESGKRFNESDMRLAEDLARRASTAIESAELYARAQEEIAERKRAEEEMRVSEVRFRTLIEQSPLSIQIFDRQGNCIHANVAWEALWGTSRESLAGYNILEDEQAARTGITEHFRRAFDGEIATLPMVYYDPAEIGRPGRPRWIRVFLYGVRDEHGNVHEVVQKTEDITEWKRAEAAVRESEGRFRMMADSAPVLIWMSDPDALRTYVNQEWLGFTGRRVEQELGEGWTEGIHPDDRERCLATYHEAFDARTHFSMEYRLRRHNGEYRWLLDTGVPRVTTDGIFAGYIGSCIDITDRKNYEIELRKAKEAAEAANNAKDQFLAVLSHELRTPLTPVLTVAHVLREEQGLPEDIRSYVEIIHRNVELEARLIDDLLDLTRIEKGKLQLNLDTVDAHVLVNNVLQIYRSEIHGKQLDITVDLRAARHMVRADSARLQQIFWNLVKNAVKFTQPKGAITIRSNNDEKGNLLVEVVDSGIGIDPEVLPRIFDAFEQGEQNITRRFGGLGLGLAISKALIDMHHGHLTAESGGSGMGSTFTVELATAEPATAPPPGEQIAAPEESAPPPTRILLVDDHADTSKVMKVLLERRGYSVTTAADVASALEAATTQKFDLLISDIGLPDGSGHDLMRMLVERGIRLKAIALSGFGMEEDIRRSREVGFIEHLTKPVNFGKLHEMIERLLTR
jgi:PAS domain S-box-containing protein